MRAFSLSKYSPKTIQKRFQSRCLTKCYVYSVKALLTCRNTCTEPCNRFAHESSTSNCKCATSDDAMMILMMMMMRSRKVIKPHLESVDCVSRNLPILLSFRANFVTIRAKTGGEITATRGRCPFLTMCISYGDGWFCVCKIESSCATIDCHDTTRTIAQKKLVPGETVKCTSLFDQESGFALSALFDLLFSFVFFFFFVNT